MKSEPTDTLLRRELKASLAREDDYRRRLLRHRELSQRLRAHTALLRESLRQPALGEDWLDGLLHKIASLTGHALDVPRTSIWLFNEQREQLVCRRLVCRTQDVEEPHAIATLSCPSYIGALLAANSSALAVNDALADPRTVELRQYLLQTGVRALLDIPIITPGMLRGVVCHEYQGQPREWLEDEIDFATDVGAVVAIALEAEERLRAERSAEGTEAKYQHLVERLPVTVYSFETKTGQLDYVSPQVRDVSGVNAQHYLVAGGLSQWLALIEPEYRPQVDKRLRGELGDGVDAEIIYPIRLQNGTRRWIRDTCGFVRDAHGRAFAAQGTLADVTALREAQLEREELERRYRELFERAEFLALILDRDARVTFANASFLRALGVGLEEALGADGFALALAEPERSVARQQYLDGIRAGVITPRFETTIQPRGGAARRILWTNTLIHAPDGAVAGAATVGVDITERLEAQTTQLEREKLESLGRLAASVAHDFNNLLTVISHGVELMALGGGAEQAAAEVEGAISLAAQLTSSLLAYARRESRLPGELVPDELVTRVLPMLRAMAGEGVTLTCELGAPFASVVIDPTQLRQVLLNLVGNAGEAVRGHGSSIHVTSRLAVVEAPQARLQGVTRSGNFYVVSISDDGRGIGRDLLSRIFDPYFTTKTDGTGLGLATCDTVVRRAGGFISVRSEPLEGSCFEVFLPATEATRSERGALRSTP